MNYICGFYAVNKKHCVINGHCVINCGMRTPQLDILVDDWIVDYKGGLSTRQIAKKYGVGKSIVQKYLAKRIMLRTRNETQAGSSNSNWRAHNVSLGGLHKWLRTNLPKPATCENCHEQPPFDVANIEPAYNAETYTREFKNWRWLCRKCHMKTDGRAISNKRGKQL